MKMQKDKIAIINLELLEVLEELLNSPSITFCSDYLILKAQDILKKAKEEIL